MREGRREGGSVGGREGGKEGGRECRREGGRECRREGGREGGKEKGRKEGWPIFYNVHVCVSICQENTRFGEACGEVYFGHLRLGMNFTVKFEFSSQYLVVLGMAV